MLRPRTGSVLIGLAVLCAAGCDSGEQSLDDANKVTICHATSSASNPYNEQRVAKDGSVSGHDGHPDDIIPAFDYLDSNKVTQHYPGKNLVSGQGILDAGCEVPGGSTTLSPNVVTTPDDSTDGSVPATDDDSDSSDVPTTDGPTPPTSDSGSGSTTAPTTSPSGVTTTSAASDTSLPPEVEVGPSSTSSGTGEAEAEAPAGGASTTIASAGEAPSSTADSALAETGSTSAPLLFVALLLLAVGSVSVLLARRPKTT